MSKTKERSRNASDPDQIPSEISGKDQRPEESTIILPTKDNKAAKANPTKKGGRFTSEEGVAAKE